MPNTTYKISVENKQTANVKYMLFMDTPDFSGDLQSWMLAWHTEYISGGDSSELEISDKFHAFARQESELCPLSNLPQAQVSTVETVHLRRPAQPQLQEKITSDEPSLEKATATAEKDAFQINTGSDFLDPNSRYVLGLAMETPTGLVAPVAVTAPRTKMNISVKPKMKFFVAESYHGPREIVDYKPTVRDAATIDFTSGEGAGKFNARVVQGKDHSFEVTYHDTL
ncbi:hypothetical protein BJY00DRAFT_315585 [Aspergillus carlsbadensis]|nr:hypothetical protein BJY00DRAFT_315585 [Aspergillus carlsbadensis]